MALVAMPFPSSADKNDPKSDPIIEAGCQFIDCRVTATGPPDPGNSNRSGSETAREGSRGGISKREAEYNERVREAKERFDSEYAAFLKVRAARDTCLRLGRDERSPRIPAPPDLPQLSLGFASRVGGPPAIQI